MKNILELIFDYKIQNWITFFLVSFCVGLFCILMTILSHKTKKVKILLVICSICFAIFSGFSLTNMIIEEQKADTVKNIETNILESK